MAAVPTLQLSVPEARMAAAYIGLSDNATFARGFPFVWARAHAQTYWHEPTEVTPDREEFWLISRHDAMAVIASTLSSDPHWWRHRPEQRPAGPGGFEARVHRQSRSGRVSWSYCWR
jgi:hypothetical protein